MECFAAGVEQELPFVVFVGIIGDVATRFRVLACTGERGVDSDRLSVLFPSVLDGSVSEVVGFGEVCVDGLTFVASVRDFIVMLITWVASAVRCLISKVSFAASIAPLALVFEGVLGARAVAFGAAEVDLDFEAG